MQDGVSAEDLQFYTEEASIRAGDRTYIAALHCNKPIHRHPKEPIHRHSTLEVFVAAHSWSSVVHRCSPTSWWSFRR
jgi:hypothetical protein